MDGKHTVKTYSNGKTVVVVVIVVVIVVVVVVVKLAYKAHTSRDDQSGWEIDNPDSLCRKDSGCCEVSS